MVGRRAVARFAERGKPCFTNKELWIFVRSWGAAADARRFAFLAEPQFALTRFPGPSCSGGPKSTRRNERTYGHHEITVPSIVYSPD